MAAHRKYPLELRERAVKAYRSARPRPTFRQLGDQLGVHPEALRGWIRADQAARGESGRAVRPRPAVLVPEDLRVANEALAAELADVRRENTELKRANEILRIASAFFAQELDPIRRRS
jgi:transposase